MTRIPFRRLRTALTTALIGLTTGMTGASSQSASPRPNIVFLYADDFAPTTSGFSGNSEVRTPHLDRLASEGAVLTRAFVTTPVCSPARGGLAASRYSSELGILDWINPRAEPEAGLDPAIVTWMELLQQSGYRTGLFGKWHLGTADRFHPTQTGYDVFTGFRDGGRPPRDALLEIDGQEVQTSGFIVDVVTDHALTFLTHARHQQPFLLSVHFREPHSAWLPTRDEDWAPFKDLNPTLPEPEFPRLDVPKVERMTREYYASVASVDRNIGRLLSALEELELTSNTLVVFTSDHGYHVGQHGLWFKGNAQWQTTEFPPQRWPNIPPRQRPNLFDHALRVPAIVRWPHVVPKGSTVDRTIQNLDWFPTLLAAAGVTIPSDVAPRGRNALPLLRGENVPWDDDLYAEYSMRHGATTDMRAWRTLDWKLMVDFANPGRAELYHLAMDPDEAVNLLQTHADDESILKVRAELEARILARMRELGDPALARAAQRP
jgi:uncharacterized sulfatase